jgi:hypothetical protein
MKKPLRIPLGVTGEDGRIGCVEVQRGLLQCLDLRTGQPLARSDFPCRPLLIDGGELVAWTPDPNAPNRLRPFAVEPGGGAFAPRWFEAVSLPDWVDTNREEPERFRLEAAVEGGRLLLDWEAHSRYEGGAPPPPEVIAAYQKDAAGRVEIDRATGAVVASRPLDPPSRERDLLALSDLVQSLPMVPYRSGTEWRNAPWPVGEREALLLRSDDATRPGLRLRVQDPTHGEAVDHWLGGATDRAPVVATDGRFLLLGPPVAAPAADWQVFSAETGAPVARMPLGQDVAAAAVIGGEVLALVEEESPDPGGGLRRQRTLEARDLATGAVLWSFPLADEPLLPPPPPPP